MNAPATLSHGRYLLVKPLGEGGMATVYRAFDQRLQVWRAVKILLPEYATKKRLRKRFEAEAHTMAILEHRHIARVYDVGHEDEWAYIVMELVEGGCLVDWLEAYGKMPARMAVQVTMEICEGLAAAHAKSIIHRDIKPHNVLVTLDGVCRVTDFGIAQVQTADASLTKTGAVMGTWGYMAPEQRTDAKSVDVRADVYAVGATLYSLLTDKMPMDLFAADRDDTMMEGIDQRLTDVLIKSTEYRRDDRYESVLVLRDALAQVLDSLDEVPQATPSLALDPGEPVPIPNPDEWQAMGAATDPGAPGRTLLPVEEGAASGGGGATLLPDTRTPQYAPTVPPDEVALSDPGAMPRQDRALYDPNTASAAPAPTSNALRWATLGVWLLGVLMIGGAIFGVVGIVAATQLTGRDEVPTSSQPPPTPAPSAPPKAKQPPVTPEVPAPVPDVPAPTPSPVSKSKTAQKSKQASTPAPAPKKIVIIQPTPAPATPTPAAARLDVTPPPRAKIGEKATFTARLSSEDGTQVTLFYRPAGSGSWQSTTMPFRLGAHRAQVKVDPRFGTGLEFYVTAGGTTWGSPSSPMRVAVYGG